MDDENTVVTNEYAGEPENKRPEKSLKIIFAIVIAALLVLFIMLGILFGKKAAEEKEEQTTVPETTTAAAETTTLPPVEEKYKPGEYTVQTGYQLNLRKDHSTDAESIMGIPENTKLTISEIYCDESADSEETKYWGKTTYKGWTAWISMFYTKKAYSDNVVEPVVTTTQSEQTTAAAEPEATTAAAPSSGSEAETGKYKVTADSYLRVREDHSVDSLAIANIEKDRELEVLEVYCDESATDSTLKYWGRISYQGVNGWVAMHYLEKIS